MLGGLFACDVAIPVCRHPLPRGNAPLGIPVDLLTTEVGWQGILPRPAPPFVTEEPRTMQKIETYLLPSVSYCVACICPGLLLTMDFQNGDDDMTRVTLRSGFRASVYHVHFHFLK